MTSEQREHRGVDAPPRENRDAGSYSSRPPARRGTQAWVGSGRGGRRRAAPGRPAVPAAAAGQEAARGVASRSGRPRSPLPPGPAHLEVVAAEVHATHERQHPGSLHGGAALAAGPAEGRPGSGGWALPAPPLNPPAPGAWKAWGLSRPPSASCFRTGAASGVGALLCASWRYPQPQSQRPGERMLALQDQAGTVH